MGVSPVDEITRLASDVQQITKRVDDMSLRLAIVENEQKRFDEKISDIKVLIIEKNNDLREDFQNAIKTLQKSVDSWNRVGWWLITLVGGAVVVALLNLIMRT